MSDQPGEKIRKQLDAIERRHERLMQELELNDAERERRRPPPPDAIQRWIERRQPWQIALGSFLAGAAWAAVIFAIAKLL